MDRYVVLLLLFVHLTSAAELSLDGDLHYNSVEVTLQNDADHEVGFLLKFQLKKKEDSWILLDDLCTFNDSIQPHESKEYDCGYTIPEEPGTYKIFAKADIVNSTYTYKEFLLGEGPKEVTLQIVSAPEKVKTGEEFTVVVNVTTSKNFLLEIYSYVHQGKKCYSFYGWKGNAEKYEFKEGETMTLNLTDAVSNSALNGVYQLKVRARGEKDWDLVRAIEVEQKPVDLFKEVETKQPSSDLRWMLPGLALLPLSILFLKKFL